MFLDWTALVGASMAAMALRMSISKPLNIPVDALDEAMRLNADDFVLSRHKTGCIEIGGTNDGRYST